MKINTVGKIILKNGQKVYKRFGAAVVLKIKLGTAAFANIVNNATTTEEGFVPDARVVAQQQQLIDQQQEAIESLNSAIDFELEITTHSGTTNNNGSLTIGKLNDSNKVWLIGGYSNAGGIIPFVYNGIWEAQVVSWAGGSTVSMVTLKSVTITCIWLKFKAEFT